MNIFILSSPHVGTSAPASRQWKRPQDASMAWGQRLCQWYGALRSFCAREMVDMAEWQSGLLFLSLKPSCAVVDVFKPANLVSPPSQCTSPGYYLSQSSFLGPVAKAPEQLQMQLFSSLAHAERAGLVTCTLYLGNRVQGGETPCSSHAGHIRVPNCEHQPGQSLLHVSCSL